MSKKKQKSKSLHDEQVATFITKFYGQERTSANKLRPLLASLKDDYSIGEILAIAKTLEKHPVAYNYIYGTPLPQSYGELRSGKYSYQSNLEKEIAWHGVSIIRFSAEINKFISYRDQFENSLLAGDYNIANNILDEIENKICYSFWGMEQRFIVAELSGGLKSNKDYLSIVNSNSHDAFVTTFAYFFSNRAENKMSVQRFNNIFTSFFQLLSNEIREYFKFITNSFASDDFKDLDITLNYNSLSSIIDRYTVFVKTVHLELSNDHQRVSLHKIIERVEKVIKDRLIQALRPLSLVYSEDKLDKTEKALEVFDNYSIGNYDGAIKFSKKFIRDFPNELSVYEIYIKSHLFLKKEFVSAMPSDSLAGEIIDNLYNIFTKNESTSQSLTNLLKIATTLQNFSIGQQLNAFYNRSILDNKNNSWNGVEFFNTQLLNPLFIKRLPNKDDAAKYLNFLIQKFPNSVTVALFEKYFGSDSSEYLNTKLISIPLYRKTFYEAEKLKDNLEYQKAIELYNYLILSDNLSIILYEDALVNLLDCYIKIGQYEDYLLLYVNQFFANSNFLIRVDTKQVIQHLQITKFRKVSPSILLPIFFHVTKQDSHNINIALRVFLKGFGLTRSADLKQKSDFLNGNALKYLLYNICTPEILKYSSYFEGTNDILLERVEILQVLVNIDNEKSSIYDSEIVKISQNLAVADAIRQIDESKIYVDEASLVNSEFTNIKNSFNRYLEITKLISDQRSNFIDISLNRKILLTANNKSDIIDDSELSKVAKNVKFELFKEVFYEIRDEFLFNNRYGLEVYISTRIRHGTLLGQFRNEFLSHHLITQKDKSSENYFSNEYWNEKLDGLEENKKAKIQSILSAFSQKIDNTANNLKEKAIQIQTEDRNKLGLFNYTIPNDNLLIYYDRGFKTVDNYNRFILIAFQLLWTITENNLDIIRKYISENVKNRLIQYLSELEEDIRATVQEERDIQELINSIKNCKTQIHLELDKIAAWFRIRKITIPDFQINKVVNSSLEITNKISQNAKILFPSISIESPTTFNGKFFIHLFDLLRIFFENIVTYSELDSAMLRVSIDAEEVDGILHFKIRNNLNQSVNRETIKEKFMAKREQLSAADWDMNKIRKEKDTGFYKAKKNLISDLHNENNNFDFILNESDEVEINIYIYTNELKA